MINVQFLNADGAPLAMEYDVHPRSQLSPLAVPDGAEFAVIWLGIRPAISVTSGTNEKPPPPEGVGDGG